MLLVRVVSALADAFNNGDHLSVLSAGEVYQVRKQCTVHACTEMIDMISANYIVFE